MSTHAMIGVEQIDGINKVIYNHFNGYPEILGLILQEAYNTLESANNLVDMGDEHYRNLPL